ncbi:MAG: GNAT family N-acetyltransferase [Saprospiraceae bacterium]
MNIEIKKARRKDFNQVFSLITEFATFIKTPEKVLITPEQMFQDEDYFKCLIAVNEDKIVGFATFFKAYYSWTGKAMYLDDLYVQPNFRGLGIGTKLFDAIIEIAKSERCKKLKWQVSNWNQKAIDFYIIKGATIDEVEINCDLKLNL